MSWQRICSLEIRQLRVRSLACTEWPKGGDLLTMVHSLGVLPHVSMLQGQHGPCQHKEFLHQCRLSRGQAELSADTARAVT